MRINSKFEFINEDSIVKWIILKNTPLVSVILLNYNNDKYLDNQ